MNINDDVKGNTFFALKEVVGCMPFYTWFFEKIKPIGIIKGTIRDNVPTYNDRSTFVRKIHKIVFSKI